VWIYHEHEELGATGPSKAMAVAAAALDSGPRWLVSNGVCAARGSAL
jgi:hypothetical protein